MVDGITNSNGHMFEQALGDGERKEAWRAAVHSTSKKSDTHQVTEHQIE